MWWKGNWALAFPGKASSHPGAGWVALLFQWGGWHAAHVSVAEAPTCGWIEFQAVYSMRLDSLHNLWTLYHLVRASVSICLSQSLWILSIAQNNNNKTWICLLGLPGSAYQGAQVKWLKPQECVLLQFWKMEVYDGVLPVVPPSFWWP